jgi:hypothetical protein
MAYKKRNYENMVNVPNILHMIFLKVKHVGGLPTLLIVCFCELCAMNLAWSANAWVASTRLFFYSIRDSWNVHFVHDRDP